MRGPLRLDPGVPCSPPAAAPVADRFARSTPSHPPFSCLPSPPRMFTEEKAVEIFMAVLESKYMRDSNPRDRTNPYARGAKGGPDGNSESRSQPR